MSFSKIVPLSRLINLLAYNIIANCIRLVCLVLFFAAVLASLPDHLKTVKFTAHATTPMVMPRRLA